jgi:hypothetical protein
MIFLYTSLTLIEAMVWSTERAASDLKLVLCVVWFVVMGKGVGYDGWLLVLTSLWRKAPSCLGFHGRFLAVVSIVWEWFLVKSGCLDCARVSGTVGAGVRFEGVFVDGSLWFLGGVAGGSGRRRVFLFVLRAGGSVVAWVVGGRG